ncbi:unnamed protein product [Schistosoma turkestanicum]|nr:unnamed protein product [Schistosoma turkestanicum]
MKIVCCPRKLEVTFVFQLFINFMAFYVTYGQIQMELHDPNNGLEFQSAINGDPIQGTQIETPGLVTVAGPSSIPTSIQSKATTNTDNIGGGDDSTGSQLSNIQPASSVVSIFPSYRPQYGIPGYYSTLTPGKGILPGISSSTDNIIVTSFPGTASPAIQPGNAVFPGGIIPGATPFRPESPVSPAPTITQQTIQTVLSYLAVHHPEIFSKYLFPKPYQKPYTSSYLPMWLKEFPPLNKYGDYTVNQPYADIYQPDPYDYYEPVDSDLHYWQRRRRPFGMLRRRRRYGLSRRFT